MQQGILKCSVQRRPVLKVIEKEACRNFAFVIVFDGGPCIHDFSPSHRV